MQPSAEEAVDDQRRETAEQGVARFGFELGQHVHARKREDFLSGVRSGVNGTPTFFISGVRYDGSWDFAMLLTVLQQAAVATVVA